MEAGRRIVFGLFGHLRNLLGDAACLREGIREALQSGLDLAIEFFVERVSAPTDPIATL